MNGSNYRYYLLAACFIVVFAGNTVCAQESNSVSSADIIYAVGGDVSFLKSAEERGVEFKENGVVKPGLEILRDHGYNWVHPRLWHSPSRSMNDLEYTIELAKEAKKYGFRFLLDYHYADSWADPGKQPTPAALDTTDIEVLIDSVYHYTNNTIIAFRDAGVMSDP